MVKFQRNTFGCMGTNGLVRQPATSFKLEYFKMNRSTHYIEREVGNGLGFVDNLILLFEGNDLPTFARREPYFFDDLPVAERVAQRLSARYPTTDPIPGVASALPITYKIRTVTWDDSTCPCCGSDNHCVSLQHISQFV